MNFSMDIPVSAEPLPFPTLTDDQRLRVASSVLLERFRLARAAGFTFGGKRDIGTIFGYSDVISTYDYRRRFARGGIAARIVEAFPKATWRGGVELLEDEDPENETEFEKAWLSLEERLHVTARLMGVDTLSRLSNYAVLLI